MFLSLVEL